jgi:serpin B
MPRFIRIVSVLGLLLPAALLLQGCELVSPPDEQKAIVRSLTEGEARVVEADHEFGLNLFRAISDGAAHENVFISPLSVSTALGMTLNGAEGETKQQIQETLALAGLSDKDINESYRGLIDLLRGLDPKVVFEIANSIWYRDTFTVEPDFLDVNRTYFDAEVQALDFNSPEAVTTINSWVDDKTHGKIEDIVDQVDPLTMMYLINAIYFNGTWTYEFDEDATEQRPFTRADGTQQEVPMMAQEGDLAYYENDDVQVVDLPYGDSLYSMTVILPRKSRDLDSLITGLDRATWDEWTGNFETKGVSLLLPRFQLEYEIELKDVLSALGMQVAFAPDQADFTRINPAGELYISNVKHKTFVEVDEEGTEAAAVTSVEVRVTSAPQYIPVHVDRPFAFAIREQHSGTILFIGKIAAL